jgi:hypothetical protein
MSPDGIPKGWLDTDNEGILMWYIDASFAVHPNMHGHTGG